MKRFYKIMFILCFAVLCTFIKSDGKAYAAWNNNAYDFYHNTSGVRDDNNIPLGADKLLIKDGSLWYCQRGVTSSAALRYRIIGHRITYMNGNSTYTIHSPLNGGITRVVDSNKYWDGGVQSTYDLWEIKYTDLYKEFIRVHGVIDAFSPLVNNHSSVGLTVDTYVTTLRNGVTLGGSVDRSGSMSGVVFYQQSDYNRFLSTGLNISSKEWNEMYNISCIIPPGKKVPAISIDGIYVSSPRNSIELYSPNGNFTDKVYVKTGKDLTIRFDSRLSYALDYYGMHATFWDTTDFNGHASGTLAMDSKSNDWTISFTNNKWYDQLNGSFQQRIGPGFTTNVKRHSRTLVTTDLTFNFPTEETYNFYPRVMTFYANRYDASNYQPRMDFNPYQDPSKRLTIVSDGTAPTISKVEITNVTSTGFDVYVYDVVDNASGVREVRVPVWTRADQSDIIWYSAVSQGNGVYKASIKTNNHGNHKGTYVVHTYTFDNVNNSACVDTRSVEVGNVLLAGITIEDYEYLDPNGVKWVQVNNKFRSNLTGDAISLQTNSRINILAQTSYELNPDGTEKQFSPLDFVIPDSMRDGQKLNNVVKGNNTDLPYFKFDDKKAFTHKINDRSFKGYAEQWFTKDVDFEYNALVRAVDKSGGVTGETGHRDQGIIVKADGNAPTSSSNSAQYVPASDGVVLKLNGVEDNRSGVKPNTVVVKVYHKNNPNDKKQLQLQVNRGNDYVVTIPSLDNLGFDKFGDYIADFIVSDNVGNVDKVGSTTFTRTEPKPVSNSIEIKDYEYKDPNTGIKWVQVGNEFSIEQIGSGVPSKPTHLYVYPYDKDYTKHLATLTSSKTYNAIDLNHNGGFTKVREFTMNNYTSLTNGVISNYYLTASSALNNNIYRLKHQADFDIYSNKYWSGLMDSSEYLGIDGEGPIVDYVQTGRNEIQVTVRDDDSGLNSIVTDLSTGESNREILSGNTQTIIINLGNSSNSNLTVTDNVGNQTIVNIGDIRTSVQSSINVEQVTVSNRKKLKVTVTAKVINPVPNQTMTLRITGDGDGVPVTSGNVVVDLYAPNGNPVNYVFYVDDKYNQPNGPSLSYGAGSNNFVGVNVGALSDLTKDYTFKLLSIYPSKETDWTEENKKTTSFASGYNHFKFNLIRLTDDNFVALPNEEVLLRNTKVSNNFINMSYVQSGKYKVQVTMYDYNGNPSGMTQLVFDHNQPEEFSQLGLNVTAVKDIAWEKETYPISYKADKSKFPLGSAYKFNNNPIKLGYALNFNIELPNTLNYVNPKAVYTVYGKDSSGNKINLVLKSGIDTLSALDSSTGTTYLSQTSNFIKENNALYLKHYLPANTKAYLADGSIYKGQIYVDLKFTADLRNNSDIMADIGRISGQYHLYSVTQDSTALDDLEVNKQR